MPHSKLPGAPLKRARLRSLIVPVLGAAAISIAAEEVQRDPSLVVREQMVVMSRQLGVTCTHCHRTENFSDGRMKTFQVAKDHMRIVELLNQQGFKGKPPADCFLCHRGKAQPDYLEKTDKPQ